MIALMIIAAAIVLIYIGVDCVKLHRYEKLLNSYRNPEEGKTHERRTTRAHRAA